MRKLRIFGGHEIGRIDCTDADHVIMRPVVADDADRTDPREDGEILIRFFL